LNREKAKVKSEDKEAFDVWEADSKFGEFTYWNHDTLPSKADHIRSVMEWLPVSAAVSFLLKSSCLVLFCYEVVEGSWRWKYRTGPIILSRHNILLSMS
jgi:hypothetical protein